MTDNPDSADRDATDRDATDRDATDDGATDRDASDRDASDRDATDRDATDRDATDRDATDRADSPPPVPDWLAAFQARARAAVERELAEAEARLNTGRLRPAQRHGANSVSSVFTLRLDHEERSALEARADVLGLKPTVLARNYIRIGLTRPHQSTDEAVEQINAALAELCARAS